MSKAGRIRNRTKSHIRTGTGSHLRPVFIALLTIIAGAASLPSTSIAADELSLKHRSPCTGDAPVSSQKTPKFRKLFHKYLDHANTSSNWIKIPDDGTHWSEIQNVIKDTRFESSIAGVEWPKGFLDEIKESLETFKTDVNARWHREYRCYLQSFNSINQAKLDLEDILGRINSQISRFESSWIDERTKRQIFLQNLQTLETAATYVGKRSQRLENENEDYVWNSIKNQSGDFIIEHYIGHRFFEHLTKKEGKLYRFAKIVEGGVVRPAENDPLRTVQDGQFFLFQSFLKTPKFALEKTNPTSRPASSGTEPGTASSSNSNPKYFPIELKRIEDPPAVLLQKFKGDSITFNELDQLSNYYEITLPSGLHPSFTPEGGDGGRGNYVKLFKRLLQEEFFNSTVQQQIKTMEKKYALEIGALATKRKEIIDEIYQSLIPRLQDVLGELESLGNTRKLDQQPGTSEQITQIPSMQVSGRPEFSELKSLVELLPKKIQKFTDTDILTDNSVLTDHKANIEAITEISATKNLPGTMKLLVGEVAKAWFAHMKTRPAVIFTVQSDFIQDTNATILSKGLICRGFLELENRRRVRSDIKVTYIDAGHRANSVDEGQRTYDYGRVSRLMTWPTVFSRRDGVDRQYTVISAIVAMQVEYSLVPGNPSQSPNPELAEFCTKLKANDYTVADTTNPAENVQSSVRKDKPNEAREKKDERDPAPTVDGPSPIIVPKESRSNTGSIVINVDQGKTKLFLGKPDFSCCTFGQAIKRLPKPFKLISRDDCVELSKTLKKQRELNQVLNSDEYKRFFTPYAQVWVNEKSTQLLVTRATCDLHKGITSKQDAKSFKTLLFGVSQ